MDSKGQSEENILVEEFISDEALANNLPRASDSMPSANGLNQMLDILDNNPLELPENEAVDDKQPGIREDTPQTDDDKLAQSMILMDKKKAYNLLTEGKRNFMVKDYNSAATMLSKASAYFAKIFGDFGLECADVYFSYGKSLLELARQENDPLEVPEDGEEDNAEDGEGEEGDQQDGDAEMQCEEGLDGDSAQEKKPPQNGGSGDEKKLPQDNGSGEEKKLPHDNGSGEEKKLPQNNGSGEEKKLPQESAGSDETNVHEAESTQETESSDKAGEASSNNLAASDSDPDEVNTLQLAWEMIEMAKIVYERYPGNEKILPHLADVYLKLGEISMEQENYETAIGDLTQALDLRKRSKPTPDRVVAEIHYKLGLAYQMNYCYEEAAQSFEDSKSILESLRMSIVEKSAHEMEEFNALVASINEKLAEVVQSKIDTKKALYSLLMGEPKESKSPEKKDEPTENKVASDISHLVKKKRKPDSEPAAENASKMARLEEEK